MPVKCNSLGDIAAKLGRAQVYAVVYASVELCDALDLSPTDLTQKLLSSLKVKLNAYTTSGLVSNFTDIAEAKILELVQQKAGPVPLTTAITDYIMAAK